LRYKQNLPSIRTSNKERKMFKNLNKAVIITAVLGLSIFLVGGFMFANSFLNKPTVVPGATPVSIEMSTGDTVSCLVFEEAPTAGVNCDWENVSDSSIPTASLPTGVKVFVLDGIDCVSYNNGKSEEAITCDFDMSAPPVPAS
jgi:hypothetical protein